RWAEQYRRRLYGRRRLALTTCLQAELRLGRHAQVLPELEDLAHADPVDEAIAALLMSAYYRAGRQAEAMHTFARTRARLREDLGADPGKDLTRLYERILTHDPDLDIPYARRTGATVTTSPAPRQNDETAVPDDRHPLDGHDDAARGSVLAFRWPARASHSADPVQDDSDGGRDPEEDDHRPAPPPAAAVPGHQAHAPAPHIGTQWNINGANATINNISGDMHVYDSDR
ncbi:BTAD domain-containing putative transcriptional regulator, partial [Streptosporangium sp. NPDC051022]|uniref:AfsR/SARP family transcriptional regulator n=1 Tax=Streptosporangium sp. NPDC051022 TaxID=3155752 RepID=UPI003418EFF4